MVQLEAAASINVLDVVVFWIEFELLELSRQGGPPSCSMKSSLFIRKRGVGGRRLQTHFSKEFDFFLFCLVNCCRINMCGRNGHQNKWVEENQKLKLK